MHWHHPYDTGASIIIEIDSLYIIAYGNDNAHDDANLIKRLSERSEESVGFGFAFHRCV